jgi:hypothetical protein
MKSQKTSRRSIELYVRTLGGLLARQTLAAIAHEIELSSDCHSSIFTPDNTVRIGNRSKL